MALQDTSLLLPQALLMERKGVAERLHAQYLIISRPETSCMAAFLHEVLRFLPAWMISEGQFARGGTVETDCFTRPLGGAALHKIMAVLPPSIK